MTSKEARQNVISCLTTSYGVEGLHAFIFVMSQLHIWGSPIPTIVPPNLYSTLYFLVNIIIWVWFKGCATAIWVNATIFLSLSLSLSLSLYYNTPDMGDVGKHSLLLAIYTHFAT